MCSVHRTNSLDKLIFKQLVKLFAKLQHSLYLNIVFLFHSFINVTLKSLKINNDDMSFYIKPRNHTNLKVYRITDDLSSKVSSLEGNTINRNETKNLKL